VLLLLLLEQLDCVSQEKKLNAGRLLPYLGEVDIKRAFPQWVAYRDQIWCVLAYVKKLFYKIETEEALHIEAAAMCFTPQPKPQLPAADRRTVLMSFSPFMVRFLTDASKFQRSVSSCVEASLRDVYINHQDSSLRFSEWNQHLNNLSDCLLDVQLPSPRLVASHIVSLTLFAVSSLEGR